MMLHVSMNRHDMAPTNSGLETLLKYYEDWFIARQATQSSIFPDLAKNTGT